MEPAIYSESTARAKVTIRENIIKKREAQSGAERNEKSLNIAQRLFELDGFKESKAVLCFLGLPNEVQTDAMILEFFRLGKEVFVPLVNSEKGDLQVTRIPSLNIRFVDGEYGVREPAPEVQEIFSPSLMDCVIAPGLAFDISGNRVGYGGGYYDKLLKEMPKNVIRIGIGFDFQILGQVPRSDFDEPVQFLVTETRTLRSLSM